MQYPGRIIKTGERDPEIIRALKTQLNQALGTQDDPALRLDPDEPDFGPKMAQAVRLFQARHVDVHGQPLKQDGEVGSLTWSALFGTETVPLRDQAGDQFLSRVLRTAAGEEAKQVREVPKNSNRGPQVDAYLERAGVRPGLSWCCAFVYWCFDEAAHAANRVNPMVKTAGCLDHWRRAGERGVPRIPATEALMSRDAIQPGMIFIMDHGGGFGHTGLIEKVTGEVLTTIEGNTDASRTREGGGVYRLTRKIGEINTGFIDYSGR
jgi:CHAP domain